jgi:redox-sensitive bicupin YhaK (pirin superfamily)
MITVRSKAELGGGDFGWLKALHHFAIGESGNPAHGPIGGLIVWNDDEIAPGTGFPMHSHRHVEIITYVREGAISHRDSLSNEGKTVAGDVQVMSAGTGITHAEFNDEDTTTKIFQIWIQPREYGGIPRWDSRSFPSADRAGKFVVLASGYPEDVDALAIRADARVLGASLAAGQCISYEFPPGGKAYVVAVRGRLQINQLALDARDGASIQGEQSLQVTAFADTEIVMVVVA